jgi:hypothetical protein
MCVALEIKLELLVVSLDCRCFDVVLSPRTARLEMPSCDLYIVKNIHITSKVDGSLDYKSILTKRENRFFFMKSEVLLTST